MVGVDGGVGLLASSGPVKRRGWILDGKKAKLWWMNMSPPRSLLTVTRAVHSS